MALRNWLVGWIENHEAIITGLDLIKGYIRKQVGKRALFHLGVAVSFGQGMDGEDLRVNFFFF